MANPMKWRLSHRAAAYAIAVIFVAGVVACGDDTGPGPRLDLGNLFHDLPKTACSGCSGCCQNGQCLSGVSVNACGVAGLTCRTCNTTDQCLKGACVPQHPGCGASTCPDGCCNTQGSCIRPPTAAACGIGGVACQSCEGGKICTGAGICGDAKPKTYSVMIHGCEIDETVKNCDNLSTCNAFAEVALGTQTAVKTPVVDSPKPVWDFKLFQATDKELTTSKLKVTIYDNDWPDKDDVMGTCEISATSQALTSGSLITACGAGVKGLEFRFSLVP